MLLTFIFFLITLILLFINFYLEKRIFTPLTLIFSLEILFYFISPLLGDDFDHFENEVALVSFLSLVGLIGLFLGYFSRKRISISNTNFFVIDSNNYLILIVLFILYLFQYFTFLINDITILDFRYLYSSSRYGNSSFYLVSLIIFIIFIRLIKSKFNFLNIILLLLTALLAVFLGKKSIILGLIFIFMLFGIKAPSLKKDLFFAFLSFIIFSIYFLILHDRSINFNLLLSKILEYSDIMRNAISAKDLYGTFNGKILFENEFFSRIPRSLFPEKPFFYGSIDLSTHYYSEERVLTGAPNFGHGNLLVDFGYYSFPFLFLLSFLKGLIVNFIFNSIRSGKSYLIITILPFIGIYPIPIGLSRLYFETFLLSIIIKKLNILNSNEKKNKNTL